MFRRPKPFKKMIMFLLLGTLSFLLWAVNGQIKSTVYEIAEIRSIQLATEVINNAVRSKIAEQGMQYQDLIKIHKDSAGRIVMIQANTPKINKISAETTLAVQAALMRMQEQSILVPLGQVTGSYLLSNLGPGIRVGVVPMGTVRVNVVDRFEQAGINQTRHSIYFDCDTDVRIIIPLMRGKVNVTTRVPVVESIIIGDVPSTFVSIPQGLLGGGINR